MAIVTTAFLVSGVGLLETKGGFDTLVASDSRVFKDTELLEGEFGCSGGWHWYRIYGIDTRKISGRRKSGGQTAESGNGDCHLNYRARHGHNGACDTRWIRRADIILFRADQGFWGCDNNRGISLPVKFDDSHAAADRLVGQTRGTTAAFLAFQTVPQSEMPIKLPCHCEKEIPPIAVYV